VTFRDEGVSCDGTKRQSRRESRPVPVPDFQMGRVLVSSHKTMAEAISKRIPAFRQLEPPPLLRITRYHSSDSYSIPESALAVPLPPIAH